MGQDNDRRALCVVLLWSAGSLTGTAGSRLCGGSENPPVDRSAGILCSLLLVLVLEGLEGVEVAGGDDTGGEGGYGSFACPGKAE